MASEKCRGESVFSNNNIQIILDIKDFSISVTIDII
jgi:hypothetical protein